MTNILHIDFGVSGSILLVLIVAGLIVRLEWKLVGLFRSIKFVFVDARPTKGRPGLGPRRTSTERWWVESRDWAEGIGWDAIEVLRWWDDKWFFWEWTVWNVGRQVEMQGIALWNVASPVICPPVYELVYWGGVNALKS